MIDIIINVISPIFLVVGISAWAGRRLSIEPRPISTAIIYLMGPCLVLDGLVNSELSTQELGQIASVTILVAATMAVIGLTITRVLNFEPALASAFVLCLILVNAANYGIPLNRFAFGEEAEPPAIAYYAISATIVTTFGIFLVSRGAANGRDALLNVFRVPLTYAGFIGIALNLGDVTLPVPIARAIAILAPGSVPAMLIVLGLQLSNMQVEGRWRPLMLAVGLRLLLAPVVAIFFVTLLGVEGLTRNVAIVESSMPTAVMAGVIAEQFGGDGAFTAAVILVSTLVSILTLSALITLL